MSQVAQCGTSSELAISTRGALACVLKRATGLPDCTTSVSSLPSVVNSSTSASNDGQSRAARPEPP